MTKRAPLLAILVALFSAPSFAAWPERPITMIVPFPAGGGTDAYARPLAAVLSRQLGQQVVIDNRGGAGGTIGAAMAARAKPDGYTLLAAGVTLAIAQGVYPSLPYAIDKDFSPITSFAAVPHAVVVPPSSKASTLADLVALAKAKPDALNYGSGGVGTPHHLGGELFARLAGATMTHIPYRGAGPAMQDLLTGRIDMMVDGLGTSASLIRTNRVKALAVASDRRAPRVADVPTAAEAGMPGLSLSSWYGLWAPKGTPPEIVARLHEETAKALKTKRLVKVWGRLAAEPGGETPQAFGAFVASETERWGKLAKEVGVKPE